MAPSPRKPRVPRLGSPVSPSSRDDDDGASFDGASFDGASRDGAPTRGSSEDAPGARVSVGRSAKVTVLHPAGGFESDDREAHDFEAGDREADDLGSDGLGAGDVEEDDLGAHGDVADRAGSFAGPEDREPSRPSPHRVRLLRRAAPDAGRAAAAGSGEVLAFPVPRAKRVRRRVILAVVSVVAFVACVMALVLFTPVLAVRTITVQGTKMLTPAQVQAALAPLEGRPLPLVGPSDVSRLVAPIVQVKSVESRAVPPNTLLVTVVERVPVALVKQTDGYSVVDGDGVQIATAKDPSGHPLPVIDPQGAHMSHETFLAVTGVLSALPADVLAQLATASAGTVDSVQLKLSNGQTVVWGNTQDRDLKAKVLEALMKSAQNPPQGQAPVSVFDVSTPWHPVTR
ncbi:FtsQ-type POTRA domain-containing protein [Sinomonas susongensis]|uniref:FtsQ-type POTRA domain-containing protein n=1 Tax=Sinomonas susongensis TaxID=1324851 RepID=UPI001109D8B6|nr:FtsQ-type POTRA domain-containing protein [Sinomonas susongensis]